MFVLVFFDPFCALGAHLRFTMTFIPISRRFTARYVRPRVAWCNNELNLVGAAFQLNELRRFWHNQNKTFIDSSENEGITWKFIPPRSPNFGAKFNLKRILGKASLMVDDIFSLPIQTDRKFPPLNPFSSDPSDFDILTPTHFLIERRLTSCQNQTWPAYLRIDCQSYNTYKRFMSTFRPVGCNDVLNRSIMKKTANWWDSSHPRWQLIQYILEFCTNFGVTAWCR